MNVRESELPGIGYKFHIVTKNNNKMVIVIHDDGRREMYHFDSDHEESISSVSLCDSEARKLAAILGGMVYKPQALETIEMAFEGITIEWFKVENKAFAIEKTIGQLEIRKIYNVTVIAIIRGNMKKLFNPGPESVIEEGDMLVVSGERNEVKELINQLLSNRGD
ncbi:cation:proton antiporter regulatory subunit [Bacillus thuringiensis]|uniref:cation:proton antiporter regulatory subunit n=1 Tax=Bacillus thuringiensis TaxID=1428 RepID=UPI0003AD7D59|nr:cation:proton antiporter regulatory subunit [Bacillus thuringiensis]MEC0028160.1 cation:proton antiporter regulatory subunit [Bacillus cereus]ETE96345.1 potassium transporter [Bacillus thuringiensis serovar aizawai str. Hu4-2]MDR5038528.1 cation:proton antiporter regulatory subunit [Bacillus thuringiensis]MEC2969775.1 cation:proton antiporter regulatory subunit [Bacillus cereus]MEC3128731.1 cation:proton antiporter regulatory subunit [Bacillus cereus]